MRRGGSDRIGLGGRSESEARGSGPLFVRDQSEVPALVARGCSSADAAARLGIGVRTVDKHLQHAFAKLGVSRRSEAATRAWELLAEAG
jgi:DNA-binding CsgD family transcriptional regulator